MLAGASSQQVGWAVVVCLAVAGPVADAAPASVLFEIKHHGGFGPRNPDPSVTLQVHSDGHMGCHCRDGRWAKGRLSEREREQLRLRILGSGFFALGGGMSRWQAWWHDLESDLGVARYFAHVAGKKKTFRNAWDFYRGRTDDPANSSPIGRNGQASSGREVGTVYKYELPKPFPKRIQVTVEPLE